MPRLHNTANRSAVVARRRPAPYSASLKNILTVASKNPMFIQHWLLPNNT